MDRYQRMYQELQQVPVVNGIAPTDIFAVPEPFDILLRNLMRQGSMTVQELADQLDLPVQEAQHLGDLFVEKGYLRIETEEPGAEPVYRIYLARVRKHNIPPALFE